MRDTIHVVCPVCQGWHPVSVADHRKEGHLRGTHPHDNSYAASGHHECPSCGAAYAVSFLQVSINNALVTSCSTYTIGDEHEGNGGDLPI